MYTVAILIVSDKYATNPQDDKCTPAIRELIPKLPGNIVVHEIIPDDPALVEEKLCHFADHEGIDLVLTAGGTGLTPRDYTPEATRNVIEREVPGISEAMRVLCLEKTSKAMLSRGIAGTRKQTLIINLPGSSKGVKESLEVILDALPSALRMLTGKDFRS